MATTSTRRYRLGMASVSQGATKVTGIDTRWLSAGINPGANFYVDGNAYANEIKQVISDTEIELVMPYIGQTVSRVTYSIDTNHQSTLYSVLSARVSSMTSDYELIRDGKFVTVNGKDAYEVYRAAGGTKTRSQFAAAFDAQEKAVDTLAALSPYQVHSAGAHNSHYRGNTIVFDDALSATIRAGTFGGTYGGKFVDLYPGDSVKFTNVAYVYPDEDDTEKHDTYSGTMRCVDLDYLLHNGDQAVKSHHAAFVPDEPMFSAHFNLTNTTEGGYVGSVMRTKILRRAEAIVKACFGADHILSHREFLCNAVTDGKPSAGAWMDCLVELMDERMIYGSRITASGSSDGQSVAIAVGVGNSQFAAFRYRHDLIDTTDSYWLRNVASATKFSRVSGRGVASSQSASIVLGVRPFFLVY